MSRLWNLISASKSLRRTQKMSRPGMLRIQEQRWRRLAQFAYAKSAFYRRHLAGLDLKRCAFEDIPVITKDILNQHWDEIVTHPRLSRQSLHTYVENPENWGRLMDGRWMISMTSGTSGPALIVPHDIAAVDWNHAAHTVRVSPSPRGSSATPPLLKPRPRAVAFTNLTAPSTSTALFMTRPWVSRLFWDYRTISATAPWDEIVAGVEKLQPEVIICYASLAGRLAQAKLDGRLRLEIPEAGAISTGGDCLTPGIRTLCKQAFNQEPLNGYGCGETLGIARQWQGMPQMLIFEDIAILESVDSHGNLCQEGELSDHALVTPLLNTALPLLRYRVNDRIRLGPVQKGWPFRTISELMGRSSMSYVFKTPEPHVFSGTELMNILEHLQQVTSYQFRQTGMDELECRFVMQDSDNEVATTEAIQRGTRAALDNGGCQKVRFKTIRVHSLEPDPRSGKVEHNVPLLMP